MIILINNRFVSKKNAKVSALGTAFNYGQGAFETMRTFHKKLFQEKEHIARLFFAAKELSIKPLYTSVQVRHMLAKITKKNPHQNQRVKIILTPEELIITSDLLKIPKDIKNGISLKSIQQIRALPHLKTLSYLDALLSREKAVRDGYFDALLTDEKGEIYEGSRCNIFWFEKDNLCTRRDKILPGTIRQLIIKLSPFPVKFKNIRLKKLLQAKEIFVTNSLFGITAVTQIDHKKISTGNPGPKTIQLKKLLTGYITRSAK